MQGPTYEFAQLHMRVQNHQTLKRPNEVLLELEIGELGLLQELLHELPQRIDSRHADAEVLIAADAHKVLSNDAPDARPDKANAIHVAAGDLDQLLKGEGARRSTANLLNRDLAQRRHKVRNSHLQKHVSIPKPQHKTASLHCSS
jgi:hypothetical protein